MVIQFWVHHQVSKLLDNLPPKSGPKNRAVIMPVAIASLVRMVTGG